MSTGTKIEWTDATWSPVTGCTKVSQGCKLCYAERMAKRLAGRYGYPADEPFRVTLHPDRLDEPLGWRKPRRVFVNSMSDLFHPDVPFEFVDQVFAVMALTPQHIYQVLTKRPERMAEYFSSRTMADIWYERDAAVRQYGVVLHGIKFTGGGYEEQSHPGNPAFIQRLPLEYYPEPDWPLPNVWLGTSVEDQVAADERIPLLLQVPAAVRFLSCEPLLGPIDFRKVPGFNRVGLDLSKWWVIVGGESGPGARPMHPEWVRSLRNQCQAAGVPFFFKGWGAWVGVDYDHWIELRDGPKGFWKASSGRQVDTPNVPIPFDRQHGAVKSRTKHPALLDGREWREFPRVGTAP